MVDKAASHDEVTDAQLAALATDRIPLESVRTLFAGVHVLYVAAVRQPSLKSSVLKEDLKELKLPAELIPDFAKIVDVRYATSGQAHAPDWCRPLTCRRPHPTPHPTPAPTHPPRARARIRQTRTATGARACGQAGVPDAGPAALACGRGHLDEQPQPRAQANGDAAAHAQRRPRPPVRGPAVPVPRAAVQRCRSAQGHGQHQPEEHLQDQGLKEGSRQRVEGDTCNHREDRVEDFFFLYIKSLRVIVEVPRHPRSPCSWPGVRVSAGQQGSSVEGGQALISHGLRSG